jgi:Uri superfamily endonuclease
MVQKGAYFLYLRLKRPLKIDAGRLKNISLPAGDYVYVGSARKGIAQRLARYKRLAETKNGKLHWHIDYLLVHPQTQITGEAPFSGKSECILSKRLASKKGVSAPAPGFGSSDCRSGCKAHLYHLDNSQGGGNGQSDGAALSRKRKTVY